MLTRLARFFRVDPDSELGAEPPTPGTRPVRRPQRIRDAVLRTVRPATWPPVLRTVRPATWPPVLRRRRLRLAVVALVVLASMTALMKITDPDRPSGGKASEGLSANPSSSTAAALTSADVGFAEGGTPRDLGSWLDAMDTYVGGKKPIIRLDLDWAYVQPVKCRDCALRWDHLDPLVEAAAARKMPVLLVLAYAPPWATGSHTTGGWFPTDDASWVEIIDRTVARYRGKIQAYEVWNEPNMAMFGNYGTGTSEERKARYWQLTRLASERVRARCPGCVVLAGGSAYGTPSTAQSNENSPSAWLEWGYAHGYRDAFDAVAHHPYPSAIAGRGPAQAECTTRWWSMFGPPDERCGELAAVRAVMLRNDDAAKKIWGTEWGYPTAANTRLPAQTVRDHLVQSVDMWRSLEYTGPLFLHSYRDLASWDGTSCKSLGDHAECHYGVVDVVGNPKEPIYSDLSAKLTEAWTPTLPAGQTLRRWAALRSPDRQYFLWLRGDGNLVLSRVGRTEAVWASRTTTAVRLVNQGDGNLVLYSASDQVLWSTATGRAGASTLTLQNDGRLVLLPATGDRPSWSTAAPSGP